LTVGFGCLLGSLADISRYAFPDGFDENVIATVLQQTLQGLLYLHQNGWLHRDIKAANLLVDGTLVSTRNHSTIHTDY